MIRDCSYYVRRAEFLELLAALALEHGFDDELQAALADIADELMEENAICEQQLRDAIRFQRTWTDPRDGVTYVPRRKRC